jgi:hypothetical protein
VEPGLPKPTISFMISPIECTVEVSDGSNQ